MTHFRTALAAAALLFFFGAEASAAGDSTKVAGTPWYKKIKISGYAQVRYNDLFATNQALVNAQGDKSLGGVGDLSFRRIRVKLQGYIHPRVFFYIQPDLASKGSHTVQLKDAYMDVYLDEGRTSRMRMGQSKVPFGYENMQSSQKRLALDRNDPLNSALKNERDLMVTFYWTPKRVQEVHRFLKKNQLKFSGDYGMFGLGIYNGQTANVPEANDNKHIVTRFSYPLQFRNKQVLELGIQAYKGTYVTTKISDGVTVGERTSEGLVPSKLAAKDFGFDEYRVGFSIMYYPQPFGLQAEYNFGKGPEYDPASNTVSVQKLNGGYVQAMYKADIGKSIVFPFVKYQYYDGGKKHELDAMSVAAEEIELGVEWQVFKAFELTAEYVYADRRFEDSVKRANRQAGSMVRLQAQLNF